MPFLVALRAYDTPHGVGQLGHMEWDLPPQPEAPGASRSRDEPVKTGNRRGRRAERLLVGSSALPDHSPKVAWGTRATAHDVTVEAWRDAGTLVLDTVPCPPTPRGRSALVCPGGGGPCEHQTD